MSAIVIHSCGHKETYHGLAVEELAGQACTRCLFTRANQPADTRHQLRDNLRRLAEYLAEPHGAWGMTREQARALVTDSIRMVEALP